MATVVPTILFWRIVAILFWRIVAWTTPSTDAFSSAGPIAVAAEAGEMPTRHKKAQIIRLLFVLLLLNNNSVINCCFYGVCMKCV